MRLLLSILAITLPAASAFATMATAQTQPRANEPIVLNIMADLSLILGSGSSNVVVTREGLAPALEAATGGNHDERIYLRAHKTVSYGDLMAVMNALRSAGYVKFVMVLEPDQNVTNAEQRTVSQTELAAMRAKIMTHWSPNEAIFQRPDQYVVLVRVQLGRDRRLSAPPQVVSTGSSPLYQATAEAAKRAILISQPFDMLSSSNYDAWKDVEINFDPRAVGAAHSR
jgi:biopolymer transport protein ExbD